jgi:hypothetical protein
LSIFGRWHAGPTFMCVVTSPSRSFLMGVTLVARASVVVSPQARQAMRLTSYDATA